MVLVAYINAALLAIAGCAGFADQSRRRGDVDDGAGLVPRHEPRQALGEQHLRKEIDLEDALHFLHRRHLEQGARRHARIVDQHVDPFLFRDDGLDAGLDLFAVFQVEIHRLDGDAGLFSKAGSQFGKFLGLLAHAGEDVGAVARKHFHRGLADATIAAGDDSSFVF